MDPVSMIVVSLATGAAAAVSETAGTAIKDAYAGVKALIQRRFAGRPSAEAALERHEQSPNAARAELEEELRAVGGASDEELIAAAKQLLSLADPEGTRSGKYNVTVRDSKGVVIGDHANVTQTFND